MSAFLGHIHHWLYAKIRRVVEREQLLYDQAVKLCGDTAEELRLQAWQSYGQPLGDVSLADVIDPSNIHGWLQRQINLAESREAMLIKELLAVCPKQGDVVVGEVFDRHGTQCGQAAREQAKYTLSTAEGLYQALQDYYLNGMPCDQIDAVIENTDQCVVWQAGKCLQEVNWKRAGIPAAVMKGYYCIWLNSFIAAASKGKFCCRQTADTLSGDAVNKYQISVAV